MVHVRFLKRHAHAVSCRCCVELLNRDVCQVKVVLPNQGFSFRRTRIGMQHSRCRDGQIAFVNHCACQPATERLSLNNRHCRQQMFHDGVAAHDNMVSDNLPNLKAFTVYRQPNQRTIVQRPKRVAHCVARNTENDKKNQPAGRIEHPFSAYYVLLVQCTRRLAIRPCRCRCWSSDTVLPGDGTPTVS